MKPPKASVTLYFCLLTPRRLFSVDMDNCPFITHDTEVANRTPGLTLYWRLDIST